MAHVQYEEWFGLVLRVIKRYGSTPLPRILELGGGTGVLARMLSQEGFRCQSSDLSFDMCRVARSRRLDSVVCANGLALPFKPTFEMVLFLYDGINYLMTQQEFSGLFEEVDSVLQPGGLFLFDVTTAANSLRYFSDYADYEDLGDYYYSRHSYFESDARIQHNYFTIFRQEPREPTLFRKFTEHHMQRVFAPEMLRRFIPSERFELIGIWDNFSFRRYTSGSERIHFLLRKKKEP